MMTRPIHMASLSGREGRFACLQSRLPLPISLKDAKKPLGADRLVPRLPAEKAPSGATSALMVRPDNVCAYSVGDGSPILVAPEQITTESRAMRNAVPRLWSR